MKDARQKTTEAGLLVEAVRHRFDGEVLEDHVIGVRPGTARLPQGTSVTLIVSDGQSRSRSPTSSGMTEDRAVQALLAKGFEVVTEEVFSKDVARGHAIAPIRPPGPIFSPANDRASDLLGTRVLRLPRLRGHDGRRR